MAYEGKIMRYTKVVRNDPVEGHTNILTLFDMKDKQGRDIGFWYTIYLREYVPFSNETGWDIPPGTYYQVMTNATRNGKDFCASSRSKTFETLDKAVAYAKKSIANSRKRYAKVLSQ